MKKQITLKWATLAFIVLFSSALQAQTLKDFFSSSGTNALYLGIDFTKNKVIDDATVNTSDIRDRQYNGLNDLVVTEGKKFDLKAAFHRSSTVDHDLGLVNDHNAKVNADQIISTNTADFHRLKEEDISDLVKGYDFKGKKGLGILFVSEAMSKSDKAIAIWVTFIDMDRKKVLFADRVEGKVGMGFGFRNFWATGIKNVLEQVEKKKYKEWKAKEGA
jgi:hypothetical protein